jgi:hypothetical protein
LYNFRVSGAHFELTRNERGEFRLSGFGVTGRGDEAQGSALRELARVGEVILEDSRLDYVDRAGGIRIGLREIRGRLQLENEELSSEIRASLHDERSGLVFGEIQATVLLVLGEDQRLNGARWQATTRELMLAALQGRVPANPFLPLSGWLNAELWGHWSPAGGHSARGVVDLKEARLANEYQDLWLERANTRFQWQSQGGRNWSLHLADFLYDDGAAGLERAAAFAGPQHGAKGWACGSAPTGCRWTSRCNWPATSCRYTERPGRHRCPGPPAVRSAGSTWCWIRPGACSWPAGRVAQARVSDWGRWPDVDGVDASVDLGRNSGRVQLSGEAVRSTGRGCFASR